MEKENWAIAEPFFLKNGSYGLKKELYQRDIDKASEIADSLGVPLHLYLTGIFYPTWCEQIIALKIRPKHLHTTWALNKFRDWVSLGSSRTPVLMEIEFVKRTKNYINSLQISKAQYMSGGFLVPLVLEDIRQKKVSLAYLCIQPEFRQMYKNLPKDLIQEYFHGIEVFSINMQARLNKKLMEVINV